MRYPVLLKSIHIALATLCLAAWGSAQFAGDYKRAVHVGFSIHEFVGVGFSAAIAIRILLGILGSDRARFSTWFPLLKRNRLLIADDLKKLRQLRIGVRAPHEGIAGLVQFVGLMLFLFIASSGMVMAIYLEPGIRATGWLRTVKDVHEVAQVLIPVYLSLHVGGVLAHAVLGHHEWREMFFMPDRRRACG